MIALRDYQLRALAAARNEIQSGKRAPLIVAPTGSGKTTIGAAAAKARAMRGGRVVWFAHRRELVKQAGETLERFGLDVGWGGLRPTAPVQVASVQAITARGEAPPGDLVVLDEAHHFVSAEWSQIPVAYPEATILGLTATPERADGRGLSPPFDSIVVAAQIADLVEAGHLVACEVLKPKTPCPEKLAMSPVDAWKKYGGGRSAVVFASSVAAAESFTADFRLRGVRAETITGTMDAIDRDRALERFETGAVRVLCNVYVLTEGWDCPRAKCAILACRIGHASGFLQRVGRVLRPWAERPDSVALLIDLHGTNVDTHGAPGDVREFSLGDRGIRLAGAAGDRFCQLHGTPVPSGGACPECVAIGRVGGDVPGVAGVELEKFAGMRRMPADKRAVYLARWLDGAAAKGHKPQSCAFKYRAVFGFFPPASVTAAAKGLAAELRRVRLEREVVERDELARREAMGEGAADLVMA